MDIELYVYDLSRGLARTMSRQFLGIQIDAVYHTSLVFGQVEYFFGMGVQTCRPGTTHHGQPMERIPMGTTHLPIETILEYLDSLKTIYTPESYDLFAHNCNNFTADFSMFLVGKSIPDHITSLPRRVLDTPFGQMLRPQLEQGMRSVTQAPLPASSTITPTNAATKKPSTASTSTVKDRFGQVINITASTALDQRLNEAKDTAACIFFTSSTCAPCRLAYPTFDQLAEQHPQALFIKIDINNAHDISSRYQIRATPTFMTFSRGQKEDEWQGADPSQLKMNVERLINQTFPPHPHTQINVPKLQFGSLKPVEYVKIPPLDKLAAKLGSAASQSPWSDLRNFIAARQNDPRNAQIPDLRSVSSAVLALPIEARFAAVDLVRCASTDPRISGLLAENETATVLPSLIKNVTQNQDTPHNLRLVTIHLASNIFSSPLYIKEILTPQSQIAQSLIELVTSSLLDASHPTTRVASAFLAFNLAAANYRVRREESREGIDEAEQMELAASLIEALSVEENEDAAKGLLLALGYLVYFGETNGEVVDLCKALDAKATIGNLRLGNEELVREVASLL